MPAEHRIGATQRPMPLGCLPPGTRIQDYRINGVLGEGGFAFVYGAEDVMLERQIAVKEYMPSAISQRIGAYRVEARSPVQQETFDKGLRSFINEARMLARFKHRALVEVLRFWEENGTAYMAMPYYRGRTLREVLRSDERPHGESWLRRLLEPILGGLRMMHAVECFHRDISTDNILVLEDGNPVLLDFGAARRIVADPEQVATVILKPGFAPIEQYSEDNDAAPQGPWTDIYALCAVCYCAITRKMPAASVARIMRDPLIPLCDLPLQGYGREFLAAIDRGLGVRPEDRPQSIDAFCALLDAGPPARLEPHDARLGAARRPVASHESLPRTERLVDSEPTQMPEPAPRPAPKAPTAAPSVLPLSAAAPSRSCPDAIERRPARSGTHSLRGADGEALSVSSPRAAPRLHGRSVAAGATLAVLGATYFLAVSPGSSSRAAALDPPATPPLSAGVPAPVAPPVLPAPVRAEAGSSAPPLQAVAARAIGREPEEFAPPLSEAIAAKRDTAALVASDPPRAAVPAQGVLVVAARPWGRVRVDGKPAGIAPPARKLTLAVGPHEVVIEQANGASQRFDVEIEENERVDILHDFAAAARASSEVGRVPEVGEGGGADADAPAGVSTAN